MSKIDNVAGKIEPAPVRVSRVFAAPRETVFKAWSSADHIKRWFCPDELFGSRGEGRDARRRRIRSLHAIACGRRSLDPRGRSPKSSLRSA